MHVTSIFCHCLGSLARPFLAIELLGAIYEFERGGQGSTPPSLRASSSRDLLTEPCQCSSQTTRGGGRRYTAELSAASFFGLGAPFETLEHIDDTVSPFGCGLGIHLASALHEAFRCPPEVALKLGRTAVRVVV